MIWIKDATGRWLAACVVLTIKFSNSRTLFYSFVISNRKWRRHGFSGLVSHKPTETTPTNRPTGSARGGKPLQVSRNAPIQLVGNVLCVGLNKRRGGGGAETWSTKNPSPPTYLQSQPGVAELPPSDTVRATSTKIGIDAVRGRRAAGTAGSVGGCCSSFRHFFCHPWVLFS